jgi:hypothetical protein
MRPDSQQWIAAKAEGDRAELAIAVFFQKYGWQTLKTIGLADYDLQLQCNVEVKNDLKAKETGNVAVEIEYRGNASGIMLSKAAWWAIVVGDEAILVKKDKLRQFVLNNDFREVQGGDGMHATLRLVPIDRLKALDGAHVVPLSAAGDG